MKGCRPLTEGEVEVVSTSFSGTYAARDKALFVLGVRSGFRISELLSLRVGDVNQHGRVVDRVTVARRHMKKKTEGRTVLLHPDAKVALLAWLNRLAATSTLIPTMVLFASREGMNRPITRKRALQILQDAFTANALTGRLGTHSMRKTFATRVYTRLNHDLVKTQHALGHKNITTTVKYLSVDTAEIDEAILAM